MGHAVGKLIEAAQMLEQRVGAHEFLIVGDGAERRELVARVERYELHSVSRVAVERLERALASLAARAAACDSAADAHAA